ncbi:MAG: membrane lipoprotein lipid attachment site-containing protein [Bacteroidota bacterium]
MKKIIIMAFATLLLTACQKEMNSDVQPQTIKGSKIKTLKVGVTRPISDYLQSDPDPNPTSPYGGALFYGNMTHLGKVHGKVVNTSFTPLSATVFSITSEDIVYAANGDELWTNGNIVITYPTDGSTTATITGGATIVGGTGRFVAATGYFIYENMVYDIVTGHESHIAKGEITY